MTIQHGINLETGEIGRLVPLDSGYEVISPEQKAARTAYFKRQHAADIRSTMRWVACYHDTIRSITEDLTLTEAGALIRLLPYLRFKSGGRLIENGNPLKQADIQRIIGRGKRVTIDILTRLEKLGVITKETNGRANEYLISVEFHTYGSVTDGARFTKLYQYYANEITQELGLNEVGLLYKILPYFHYRTFYLCANPDEGDETLIDHLTREKLAESIGHEPDTVTRLVNRLQANGVIMSTKSMNSVNYIVHPDVMYRQDSVDVEYTEAVRKMFAQHRRRKA